MTDQRKLESSDVARDQNSATAFADVAQLSEQAERLRKELAQLRSNLEHVRREYSNERTTQLVEANEALVRAALHSDSIADAAVSNLADLARSLQCEQDLQLQHLREANERLVLAALSANELEERAESKHRQHVKFIAMVAHELRNPLNPIRNAAELLKRVRNEERLADVQSIIERQVKHMAQLIDDLLDGSREDIGKFRVTSTNVDIVQIIAVSIESCRTAIETRRQRLSVQLPPGPIWIAGDPIRLTQIFSNLLDNASKYTLTDGDISLSLETHNGQVLVTIADKGIGISPEALPRIFDLFVQEDHALRLHRGGLGIGLSVVRDLVEAHGGQVTATSAGKGCGSQFVVSLPLLVGPKEEVTNE